MRLEVGPFAERLNLNKGLSEDLFALRKGLVRNVYIII